MPVRQMRLVVTADDYDEALHFYRDVLGLPELGALSAEAGHVTILDAGRATLELTDPRHAAHVDRVEVGERVAGHIRVAFEVDDSPCGTTIMATPVSFASMSCRSAPSAARRPSHPLPALVRAAVPSKSPGGG